MVPACAASSLTYSIERMFILKAAQRFDQDFRRFDTGRNGARDLTPQRDLALVGDITLLAEAELPQRGLEARWIERAADALEIGIVEDHPHGFGGRLPEPQPPRLFVKGGLGNGLLQHLAVETEGARLVARQRTAELAADLLQPLGIDLTELFGRNLGPADLGQRRLPEPLEDVCDAPDAETDDQYAHHHGHYDFAEPV